MSSPPKHVSVALNGNENGIHQPRARKPMNPQVARALHEEHAMPQRSPGHTPAPPDNAPPSIKTTSAVRREIRRKTKDRIFPTVKYEKRVSYFDPKSEYANFRGFFVLFWIGLAIMVITAMLRNLKETGSFLNWKQWPLFTENIWELAACDLTMCATTGLDLPLNLLYKNNRSWLKWNRGGVILQSLVQAIWLYLWIAWPFARRWTWTAQVFFTLHTLLMLMKMHSYAFYCGHLSTTLGRLKELDLPIGPQTPTTAAVRYPHSFDFGEVKQGGDDEEDEDDDRHSHLSPIMQLREDLAKELTSPQGRVTYPDNLTVANYLDYLLCPTLCYELEYPRNPQRDYMDLFWKTLAVFGCIFLMTVTSEEFIIPVLDESRIRLQQAPTWIDQALIFAEAVSSLLFPFMVTFLLVFLVIFEYVLGAFAEITRFADRRFYSDWWNSLDWLEFSREWNLPVHLFLRRHVYSASRGLDLPKPVALAITFATSAILHELVMACITRKFRGYGFALMLLQMPFAILQRLPGVRHRSLLLNVMFWISMITGLSLLCALYVLV